MKISRCLIILLNLLILKAAPAVMANTIVLTQGAYSYYVGGEFRTVTTPQSFLNNYVPATIVNGGFQTFCVETTVEFTPGVVYSFTLSNTDSQGRPLTQGAAFLYYEFAKGILPGYDYNTANTPADAALRLADAGELQSAIWWLQGGQTYPGYSTGGAGNPFYDLALADLGAANLFAANNGRFGVDILELWNGTTPIQNQLVVVPDPGWTALLLGMSVTRLLLMQLGFRKPHRNLVGI